MICINARGAVYGEVWYDEQPPGDCGVDIVLYRQREAPITDARTTPFLSLVTDLSVTEDAIAGQFGKDCRYKIKRAESKDGLRMEFITEPESRLDEFRAFYDAFARQKSLEPSDRRWLVAACKTRQLALASATQNGETLVWHAYVMLENAARFQYSGSFFRNRDSHYRALVGRANRWLHWRDMLQLKQMGIKRYDWGGLFEDESVPEHAGVNNFKKEFGGQPERTYDCTVPVTVRGSVYLAVRDAWRRRLLPLVADRLQPR
jgi:lipid II:glycine glycyltransferase (peptidoglycan interpeptide bridge formation enzyme)